MAGKSPASWWLTRSPPTTRTAVSCVRSSRACEAARPVRSALDGDQAVIPHSVPGRGGVRLGMRSRTIRGPGSSRRGPSRRRRAVATTAALVLAFVLVTAAARRECQLTSARSCCWPRVTCCPWPSGSPVSTGRRCSSSRRGQHGYGAVPTATPGVKLICFDPDPGNTRGEAEFAGRLAKKYHWRSVVLVTSRAQDTRARILVGRCFGGPIYAVADHCRWATGLIRSPTSGVPSSRRWSSTEPASPLRSELTQVVAAASDGRLPVPRDME